MLYFGKILSFETFVSNIFFHINGSNSEEELHDENQKTSPAKYLGLPLGGQLENYCQVPRRQVRHKNDIVTINRVGSKQNIWTFHQTQNFL